MGLVTPFGEITIQVNGKNIEYKAEKLKLICIGEQGLPVFKVDGRYRIKIEGLHAPGAVSCRFISDKTYSGGVRSGECLALKVWNDSSIELSIGTEDEIAGTAVEYLNDGLRIVLEDAAQSDGLVFQIAWLVIHDLEREDSYTWFAADPTYCKE